MPTLQELRKRKFKTIRLFAMAYGKSDTVCSHILNGRHHHVLSKEDIHKLASVLEVSFEECVAAANVSYAEWCQKHGYSMSDWQTLEAQWKEQDEIRQRTERAYQTGDWETWRRQYRDPIERLFGPLLQQEIFDQLGIPITATPAQIKAAFARKARAMHPDSGGTGGDLDQLVQAKEKALEYAQKR